MNSRNCIIDHVLQWFTRNKSKQKCKEFLAFSSPEMRFLQDSSSCSNKYLSNAKVEHF